MALINFDKFLASFIEAIKVYHLASLGSLPFFIKKALEDQGFEYKDGKIVKTQDIMAAESEENGYGENERIRKSLIRLVHLYGGEFGMIDTNTSVEEAINWLEKQGEKKPIVKTQMVYPKFRIGDVISPNIEDDRGDYTIIGFNKTITDYLVDGGNVPHCSIGIEFIEKNYHLKEQKPAWSKEDERIRQCLIRDQEKALDDVHNDKYGHSEIISDLKEMYRERIDWLKSIKQRYTWKPSDEQMKALANALSLAKNCGEESAFDLRTLYEQLKKLKGE